MSSNWFYEPFYTINDFDRLFDEAFANRSQGAGNNNQQQQVQRRRVEGAENSAPRALRPR